MVKPQKEKVYSTVEQTGRNPKSKSVNNREGTVQLVGENTDIKHRKRIILSLNIFQSIPSRVSYFIHTNDTVAPHYSRLTIHRCIRQAAQLFNTDFPFY